MRGPNNPRGGGKRRIECGTRRGPKAKRPLPWKDRTLALVGCFTLLGGGKKKKSGTKKREAFGGCCPCLGLVLGKKGIEWGDQKKTQQEREGCVGGEGRSGTAL